MSDIFDDDEEDPPIYFEQDPESDDITHGYWTGASGQRRYGQGDLADVRRLEAEGKVSTGKDVKPGMPATNPLTEEERASVTSATTPTPEELQALGGASPEAAESPRPAGQMAPEAPAPASPAAPAQQQPLATPALPGARGPARYTDTAGSSASRSESLNSNTSVARTGSAQDKGEFQQQQGDIAQSYDRQGQAQDEGSARVAGAIQNRRAQIMQMAQDKEAATSAVMAQRDARANQVKTKIVEVSARKTDHNKIWKDKGALGTTLGLLGVALRSLTATKFGGPNTALQSIQEQKKQNLQAQMEDRDSELRGLEKELGSLDAAVPVFEARMNDALSKRIDAMMLDEKSATVIANAKTMKGQLETEKAQKLAEGARAYAGTLATQESQGRQQSAQEGVEQGRSRLSGAGVGDTGAKGKSPQELYADLLELDKKEEERGVPREDRARKWQAYGFKPPAGESAPEMTNREQKEKVAREEEAMNEDQSKAESGMAMLHEQAEKSGLKRDQKTGKWTEPGGIEGTIVPGWSEGIGETFGQSTPIRDSRELAQEAFGRLVSGGAIQKDEEARFGKFFGEGKATRNQIASKLNELETLVNSRRKTKFRNAPRSAPDGWRGEPREKQP